MNRLLLTLAAAVCLGLTNSAWAQPVLHWNFDEATSGDQNALDAGTAPAENGIFRGGATRTTNTPGGASTAAADLYLGASGNDAYIEADSTASIEELSALTLTTWINLQDDPVGNDRIAALQNDGTPPDADFDDSGTVEAADLPFWQSGFGIDDGTAVNGDGDANGDGNVLGDDFLTWQRQLGGPIGPPFGQFAGFSLNINAPVDGTLAADNFRLGMFIGGIDGVGDPIFDFGQSTVDVELAGDQWLFIATTFDGSTGDLVFYVGTESTGISQLGDAFVIEPFSIEFTASKFYVGKTDGAPAANTSLEGFVDDVRIYDTALDAAALDAVRLANLASSSALAVPEPGAISLLVVAAVALAVFVRRR